MTTDYKVGTLIFAKMKGYPYWPGVITNPTEELKKAQGASKPGNHCVFFFGSKNYQWIEADKLKLYLENKEELTKATKTASFKKACEEIEDYIAKGHSVSSLTDPFEKLMTPYSEKSGRVTKRKSLTVEDLFTPVITKKKDTLLSHRKSDVGDIRAHRKSEILAVEIEKEKKKRTSFNAKLSDKEIPTKGRRSSACEIPEKYERKASIPEGTSVAEPKCNLFTEERTLSSPFSVYGRSSLIGVPRPESPPLDIEKISDILSEKKIEPSNLKFGFLGLGKIGCGLLKNLLNSKHMVYIWNRTQDKCTDFIKVGAEGCMTPGDVVEASDITFCCVSDSNAVKVIVSGNCGALPEIKAGKSFVDMSGIDPDTSQWIADQVTSAGGRYLEVRFQGSKPQAEEGSLILMAAGDRSLYDDCSSCFSAFSIKKAFLGEVGKASTSYLILQSVLGSILTGLSEVMLMAEQMQIPPSDLLEMFSQLKMLSPFVVEKCRSAMKGEISPHMALKHLQKDVQTTLNLATKVDQKIPILAMTNEHLKGCKSNGYKDLDIGAIFLSSK